MSQEIRYAKARVRRDPDRDNDVYAPEGVGVYTGMNVTTHQRVWSTIYRERNTRGACG